MNYDKEKRTKCKILLNIALGEKPITMERIVRDYVFIEAEFRELCNIAVKDISEMSGLLSASFFEYQKKYASLCLDKRSVSNPFLQYYFQRLACALLRCQIM